MAEPAEPILASLSGIIIVYRPPALECKVCSNNMFEEATDTCSTMKSTVYNGPMTITCGSQSYFYAKSDRVDFTLGLNAVVPTFRETEANLNIFNTGDIINLFVLISSIAIGLILKSVMSRCRDSRNPRKTEDMPAIASSEGEEEEGFIDINP